MGMPLPVLGHFRRITGRSGQAFLVTIICAPCDVFQTRCLSCHGNGWSADSSGYRERCYYCQASAYGDGKQDCLKCNAKGRVACPPCDSYGQVRCYIRLTISWLVPTA